MPERTPNGGVSSLATFFDVDGKIVSDATHATTVEIVEYSAERVPIARTYMNRGVAPARPTPASEVRGDPVDDDFAKDTWDVWYTDAEGHYHLVDSVDTYMQALGDDPQRATDKRRLQFLSGVMGWKSWDAAPDSLKREAYAWLNAYNAT